MLRRSFHQRRLPSLRPFGAGLDHQPGVHLGQSGRAGTHRHGGVRRQVWHHDRSFYWVGAIPAMLFMGIFMMPFYYGSKARSVPEYLKMRFDEKTRGFNAITFAVMTVFSSGISMYALGLLLHLVLGWNFNASVLASGGHCPCVYLSGRTHQRDLQRGPAVLPDCGGIRAAGDSGLRQGRRMARHRVAPARQYDALLEVHGQRQRESDGRGSCSEWSRGSDSC